MAVKILTPADEYLLWHWMSERHAIYLKRQRGESKPWSSDPIFQQYKFTNVFRELDTGTIWLRENFLEPHRDNDLGLIAFNCAWYRMFNWKGTGELLGWQTDWNIDYVTHILTTQLENGGQVFTGAHIVRSDFNMPKIESIVTVCSDLYRMRELIKRTCERDKSLEATYRLLLMVRMVGPFMAYEMVTDMRHTRLLEDARDIWTWANAGPGAMRGLARLDLPWSTPASALQSMQELLARSKDKLPEWMPALEMRDIEHSLCEMDKYARVKFGEGRPRGRYPGI